MEHHLPYGITYHSTLNRGKCTSPQTQPDGPILDLPTMEKWKTDTVLVIYQDGLPIHRESTSQVHCVSEKITVKIVFVIALSNFY